MTSPSELEEEHVERLARAHAALADAQDRTYWLERWGLDLNALMRKRGAAEVRAGLRLARGAVRATIMAKRLMQRVPAKVRAESSSERSDTGAAELPDEAAPNGELSRRSLSPDPLHASPVTDLLYGRLTDDDVAAVRRAAGDRAFDDADAVARRRLVLNLGVRHHLPGVLERTGLVPDLPPEEVHAMERGENTAGGSVYYADLVADGFASSGKPIEAAMSALDFGCSSGRVVRVLQAAHPDCEWHGCDPIPVAIDWASAHLPEIAFARSPERPPVHYDTGSFDLVYAISIWSHFAARAGLSWLAEMHRILKPGGALLLTSHGLGTVAHSAGLNTRPEAQLRGVMSSLYAHGFWFENEFGAAGDHGIANPDWGTAFLTSEWLLAKAGRDWRICAFAPARLEDNQDMYVLERR